MTAALYAIAAVLLLAALAASRYATRTRFYAPRMAWTVTSAVCVLLCTYAALYARRAEG